MSPRHIALALVVILIWGFNFVVMRLALDQYPPMLLVALRFAMAAVPVLWIKPPKIALWRMLAIGLMMFGAQYVFLYLALVQGFPAGLSSVALQIQAFMTIILAALVLGERPSPQQMLGTLVAFAGLAVIGYATSSAGIPLSAVLLLLAAALMWAIANVLVRGAGQFDTLAFVVWASLVPPLPIMAISLVFEGVGPVLHALASTTWLSFAMLLYTSVLATILGFGIWGILLKSYPAGKIAPLTLLVPIIGAGSAALFLGEPFGPVRLAGMALVVAGLVIVALPRRGMQKSGGAGETAPPVVTMVD